MYIYIYGRRLTFPIKNDLLAPMAHLRHRDSLHKRGLTYAHIGGGAWELPFRFWGLGQGDLGFRAGAWGLPFRFWGMGQNNWKKEHVFFCIILKL